MSKQEHRQKFVSTMEAHKGILYKVANAYCQEQEDREDLVQEMLIRIWQSFPRYNPQYKMSTWLYRIALNVAISRYRKTIYRQRKEVTLENNPIHLPDDRPDEEAENKINILRRFIDELKELDKALMLLYMEEKSHQEIAEILGISQTNVATKIGRIKAKLKERFTTLKQEI